MPDPASFTNQAGMSTLIIMVIQWLKGWKKFAILQQDSSNFVQRLFLTIGAGIGTLGISWSYNQATGSLSLTGFQAGVPLKIALLGLAWKWFCAAAVTHGAYIGLVKNDTVRKIANAVVAALKPSAPTP